MWRVPFLNCTYTIIPVSRVHPFKEMENKKLEVHHCLTGFIWFIVDINERGSYSISAIMDMHMSESM